MSTLQIKSPIDGSLVGELSAADAAAVAQSYDRLAAAQSDWATQSLEQRSEVITKMAGVLRDNADELTDLIIREIGKTPDEARSEVVRSADIMEFVVAEAAKIKDYTIQAADFPGCSPGRYQTVTRVPQGVVLAISPFNYPINLAITKLAPALVMGNVVLFKPPTQGAVSAAQLVELWQAAGLTTDVLQIVTGSGAAIGDALVDHPALSMIMMTGSSAVGRRLAERTALIPLMLELGGNDPAVVLHNADIELAAKHIARVGFQYAGQRCTAIKRVYGVDEVADALVAAVAAARDADYGTVGDPREHPLGPVISDQQADFLQELFDDAVARGATVVRGGERNGRFWSATVLDRVPADARVVVEEQFGPILPIVRVQDADEAVRLANDSDYALQAAVYSADVTQAETIAGRIEAGGVHLNGPDQRGPDNFLFIGHKQSGLTAQGVRFTLDAVTKPKGIIHN